MPPSTIALFHFDEVEGVAPSDATGNLDDLSTEPGINEPAIIDAWTGRGRLFLQSATSGLLAADVSGNGTLLPRSGSIVALLTPKLAGAVGPMTVLARGLNDGSISERYNYGLELEEQAGNPGYLEVRWFRQDGAGAIKTLPPGVFKHAGDATEIMITATHRWESAARCVVRYYIDKRMIAELVFADGGISGGVTGTMSIGARKAAGVWSRHFNGSIDELQILDYELSPEEVEQTWNRLTVHQPAGGAMFRGLAPRGVWWFENPSNAIGRRAKVVGEALGLPISAAEEFRATFLPDRCPAILIPRWEKLCAITPKPNDSLDVRRTRVCAHLAADEGYSIPALQQAFSGVFGVTAEEVEIIEYTNEIKDSFNTLEPQRWQAGDAGTWSVAAGELALHVATAVSIPLDATPIPCHLRTGLDHGDERIWIGAKMVNFAGLPAGSFAGVMMHCRRNWQSFWFGVYNDAGTKKIGYRITKAGVSAAFVSIVNAGANGPLWLRVDTLDQGGSIDASYSTAGPSSGFTTQTIAAGLAELDLGGFGAWTTAALGVDLNVTFDDFTAWCPGSLRPFAWFAYRDLALLGTAPDLIGANTLARRVTPAHMYARACAAKSLICGDAIAGQVGNVPMGVIP